MTGIANIINCTIVDDEPLPISLLSEYIGHTPGLSLIHAIRNPVTLLQAMEQSTIHILFLDIQMPQLNGLQLARLIQGKCEIVITSAFPQYALDGYEHDLADYLLKPFGFERFLVSINKCKKRMAQIHKEDNNDTTLFFVKTGNQLRKINHIDVLYLEAMRDYIAIHLTDEKIMTLQSLTSFEEQLPSSFVRIHRSFIINSDKVTYIETSTVKIYKTDLPVGEKYQDRLRHIINRTR